MEGAPSTDGEVGKGSPHGAAPGRGARGRPPERREHTGYPQTNAPEAVRGVFVVIRMECMRPFQF